MLCFSSVAGEGDSPAMQRVRMAGHVARFGLAIGEPLLH